MRTPRHVSGVLVLVLGVLLAGCARATTVDAAQSSDATLRVDNHNFNDVDIFVVHPGEVPQRLGMVTGVSSGSFAIPRTLLANQPIRVTAVPIGGVGEARSGPLTVYGGQTVQFTVEADLHLSTAVVR
jgi:hypothetical protein